MNATLSMSRVAVGLLEGASSKFKKTMFDTVSAPSTDVSMGTLVTTQSSDGGIVKVMVLFSPGFRLMRWKPCNCSLGRTALESLL